MAYVYFVSYNDTYFSEIGRCEVTRDAPITTIEDIAGIEETLRTDKRPDIKGGQILIINFKLLREVSNDS